MRKKLINIDNILLNFIQSLMENSKLKRTAAFVLAVTTISCLKSTPLTLNSGEVYEEANMEQEYPDYEEAKAKLETAKNKLIILTARAKTNQEYDAKGIDVANEIKEDMPIEEEVLEEKVELTQEEKIDLVLEQAKLTTDQLKELICTTFGEAGTEYEECYNVTSIFVNRTHSYAFVNQTNNCLGENAGYNVYAQMRTPGQFVAYEAYWYNYFMDLEPEELASYPGYDAVLDCLLSNSPSHDYLAFKSAGSSPSGKEQLTEGGNRYHRHMTEDDTIPEEERLVVAYGELARSLYKG